MVRLDRRVKPPAIGPFRPDAFTSPARSERTAAVLGIALGVSFGVCFLTGLYSHLAQHPTSWFTLPARPAGLYRFTQGLHVATGLASIPLLLAKLWSVFPKLFAWPPFHGVASALERLSLLPLVGGAVFMLFSGLANINLWYPWNFNFPVAHYWVAWITIGALVVHIGAKVSTTCRALRREHIESTRCHPGARRARRGARHDPARAAADRVRHRARSITAVTVGQTFRPLRKLALLAPRRPDTGPQGFPVNRTARAAGVLETARSDDVHADRARPGGDALRAHARRDPLAPPPPRRPADRVRRGLEQHPHVGRHPGQGPPRRGPAPLPTPTSGSSRCRRTAPTAPRCSMRSRPRDADTLLALEVDGETLAIDHGYPLRLIAPNRPGVNQTKWVTRLVVL